MLDTTTEPPLVAATGITGMIGRQAKEQFPDLGWEPLMVDITDRTAVTALTEITQLCSLNFPTPGRFRK
jgi:hypothetical protein